MLARLQYILQQPTDSLQHRVYQAQVYQAQVYQAQMYQAQVHQAQGVPGPGPDVQGVPRSLQQVETGPVKLTKFYKCSKLNFLIKISRT